MQRRRDPLGSGDPLVTSRPCVAAHTRPECLTAVGLRACAGLGLGSGRHHHATWVACRQLLMLLCVISGLLLESL